MNAWTTIKLGEIIKTNTTTYSEKLSWNYVNYLDTGNITENIINHVHFIDLEKNKLPSRAKRLVKFNSILYSTVRPNQRHYGIIKNKPENFLVSTGFAVIDVNPELADADFIYFLLTQNSIVESLHAMAEQSVSAYPSIKPSDIENLQIELPPIKIQKRIAGFLKSISDKMIYNTLINQNLEQQAQLIFDAEFLSHDDIPAEWQESNLLEIADYLNGLAMQKFRPSDDDMGLPVLKIKELRQGFCDETSERCSSNIKSQYIVHDGDVVFSWSGSLMIDFWCGGTCGLNQHLFKVTSPKYDKWFYYAWTNHHLKRFISIAADMATTMGHIKREELAKSKVLIPSAEDYQRIGSLLQPIYDMIIINRIQNRELSLVRDNLLPKLMSGEIDLSGVCI